jgi:hypothetical protein
MRPYLKNTQYKKRAGRVAQVVKCLPSMLEALSSNHQKKGKRKEIKFNASLEITVFNFLI